MAASWDHLGEIAEVAQLTGFDAVRLIGMIVKAASTARLHKKNCMQFAMHLRLIGNLLQQLKISELKKHPETREPLEQLEDALRRSYILVNSCQDRSYLYLLAMGWTIVYQFRKAQEEIDRYLKIIPLITLVDNARVRETFKYIEMDQHEYTLDDDDRKVQDVIMNPDPSKTDAVVLRKSLSFSYPDLPFNEVIKKENEKLHLELQHSQSYLDVGQCEMIQRLMEIADVFASDSQFEKDVSYYPYLSSNKGQEDNNNLPMNAHSALRSISSTSSRQDLLESHRHEEWHSDLLGCCSEPMMCLKTFLFPCGTLSKIATVATNRHMTSVDACNELVAYSLIVSCCCYTCCIRRKLRNTFNIRGGCCHDFVLHFCCCCCALVQELREIEMRRIHGPQQTKTSPPSGQYMES
ncbi:protein MID1-COMPLEMENTING ACTIVITY 1-like [Cynara cardunculus var. scolymus]|uniref:protein MID1-COMPLEMENTING ACTIVITY 1-like n=1 Tax=Cynara cardunculus var. scolymus TaxID=59895 RepID=UPI000D62A1CB|nr:protein MID1-COMPLEMENTING ACTIVITY 1-like [Cynara cardunculus var. scolymus]